LKLIRGADEHPSRLKDDRPKIDERPVMPPGLKLSSDEQAIFDWLLEHVYRKGVHGTGDAIAFAKIARLTSRVNAIDAKIAEHGLLMKNPKNKKPELQPYTRLSRDLWQQLGIALGEIGATPAGRVKLAGPHGGGALGEPSSWDEIN
jgi:hypothetical protein